MRISRLVVVLVTSGAIILLGLAVWALGQGSSEAQQDTMHNCPQPSKWAIAVWDGDDDTATGQALASCGAVPVDFAYYLDPVTNNWQAYFEGQPLISKLLTLDNMQGVLAHGAVAPLTPTPSPTPTPGQLACADGSTQQFQAVDADAPWSVYCPTFLPDGYELDDIVYGLDIAGAAPEGGVGAVQAQFVNPETGGSITFIQGLPGLSALTSGIRGGEALGDIPYGDFQAELFRSSPDAPDAPFLAARGSSDDITHWIEAIGPTEDETRQIAAGMWYVKAIP